MLKHILGLIALLTAAAGVAQVKTVRINVNGYFEAAVSNGPIRVTVNEQGRIAHIGMKGAVERYPYTDMYGRGGRVSKVGGIVFDYYPEHDVQGRGGKLSRVGEITFDYYDKNDIFGRTGRLSRIGSVAFDYYDRSDIMGRSGRISRIGDCSIDYYPSGDPTGRDRKIRQIGSSTFDYAPQSAFGGYGGRLSSGPVFFTERGIAFQIWE